jgi:endo-1,4-beta-D-glucanase Y
MRIPSTERAFCLWLVAASLLPIACRDDDAPPPVEGTGGSSASGGRGGSAGRGGAGGAGGRADAAASDAVADTGGAIDGGASDVAGETGGAPDAAASDGAVADAVADTGANADGAGDVAPVSALRPFYSAPAYPAGVIRPTGPQSTLDNAAAAFYTRWKRDFVVNACGGSYVSVPIDVGANLATTSEIHGPGMIATVIYAGHDAMAKATFDGLFRFARMYRSSASPVLMASRVTRNGMAPCMAPAGSDAQTDGDVHIAMSLLMADKQWGSAGAINYLDEAKKTIAAIKQFLMHPVTKLPMIGDYAANDVVVATRVRSSDLMPGHFQAFATATADPFWNEAVGAAYDLIGRVQAGPSMMTGLLPDFIINTATATPMPAVGGTDGLYYYHAARAPLYLGLDYISNSTRAQNSKVPLEKLVTWFKTTTGNLPQLIVDGYQLNGMKRPGNDVGESALFETPIGVASQLNAANQAWLDATWTRAIRERGAGVAKDSNTETPQLLSVTAMSGHWWAP